MIIELHDIILKPQPRGRNAGKHVFYPPGWNDYKESMQWLIKQQAMKQEIDFDGTKPLSIALLFVEGNSVMISLQNIVEGFHLTKKPGDLDNYNKAWIDFVSQTLDFNDKQIYQIMSAWY